LLEAERRVEQAQVSFGRGLDAARQSGSLALQRKLSLLLDGCGKRPSQEPGNRRKRLLHTEAQEVAKPVE
jgi:hypothetical protein